MFDCFDDNDEEIVGFEHSNFDKTKHIATVITIDTLMDNPCEEFN